MKRAVSPFFFNRAKEMEEEAQPMDPNVWGPPLWDLMFSLCFKCAQNPQTTSDLQHLFLLLEKVMPCSHCRRSYALYRKQVKPTTVIRAEVPNSAAMWLWTIHDMVNQKLGKICISYEKLEKRHRCITVITHDLLVMDIFVMVALSVKKSHRNHVVEFVTIVLRLLVRCNCAAYFRLNDVFANMGNLIPDELITQLYNAQTQLYTLYGMQPLQRDAFDQRFKDALA